MLQHKSISWIIMGKLLVIDIITFLPSHNRQVSIISSVFISKSGSKVNERGTIGISDIVIDRN